MQSRREEAWKQIIATMSTLVARPCQTDLKSCIRLKQWYSTLTNNLQSLGLNSLDMSNKSINDFMTLAQHLEVPAMRYDLPACHAVEDPNAQPKTHPAPMTQASFNVMLGTVHEKCNGLCLDCVRAGGINEGKCRIKHA